MNFRITAALALGLSAAWTTGALAQESVKIGLLSTPAVTKHTMLERRGLELFLLRLDNDCMFLKCPFLLGNIFLQLFDLAFLVVLELSHVAIKLLDVVLGGLLLLLRGDDGSFEIIHSLLRTLHVALNLQRSSQ